MDTSETPRPRHELARLSDLPPALRAPLPPASRPSGGGGGLPINPRLVLRGLARHWWQALALWVVGSAALATLVYLKFQPTYKSSSMLMIRQDTANPYTMGGGGRTSKESFQTQVQLILSTKVLTEVIPVVSLEPGVREARDAEVYLRSILRVVPQRGTNLIEVSAESEWASEAASVVNAVVKAYLDSDAEWSAARTKQAIDTLEDYENELENRIKALQEELLVMIEQTENPSMMLDNMNMTQPSSEDEQGEDSQLMVDVSQYQQLNQALLDLEYEEIEARAELEAARRRAAETDPRVWVDRRIEQAFLADPDIQSLRAALRDLDARIAEARDRIRNAGDPAVSRLMAQRQMLLERYDQLWADMEPQLRAQLAAEEGNPVQEVRQAEAQLARLEQEGRLLQEKLKAVKLDDRSRGKEALEIAFMRADLDQQRKMQEMVQSRLEELRFEARGSVDTIIVINEAKAGLEPLSSKRNKLLAATPLAMFGLVLGLVTLVELRGGRVSGADELSGRLAAEVFAVPPLPSARSAEKSRLEGPGRDPKFEQFVQQLDHLRVALCGEGGQDGRGRCVLITSAVGGEGKTTLAAQLAVRCAEAGASTVIIDADLRRATLGRLFEVPDCPGLSDVLRGDATLEDALVPISQVGGCQLLPAGSPEANPNRILRGKAFAPTLERLRRSFDVVIIDTSPVLPVPDALILGRLADGAVIATRHDQSRFPAVERANSLLAGAGIPVLGVVVNGARSADRRFGAGYAAYSYRPDRMPGPDADPSAS